METNSTEHLAQAIKSGVLPNAAESATPGSLPTKHLTNGRSMRDAQSALVPSPLSNWTVGTFTNEDAVWCTRTTSPRTETTSTTLLLLNSLENTP